MLMLYVSGFVLLAPLYIAFHIIVFVFSIIMGAAGIGSSADHSVHSDEKIKAVKKEAYRKGYKNGYEDGYDDGECW